MKGSASTPQPAAPYKIRPHLSLQKIFLYIEDWANRYFSSTYNPFYYFGAISTFFFVVLVISGVYLFIFYRTNNPYQTVQHLTEKQWYAGGIMRSIHRYASDGLMIFLLLHTIREFLNGRYRHRRWLAWISGTVLLIISLMIGITGYWLVWDERAQLIALETAKLLDDIPIFVEPPPRSFLSKDTMSVMFFFLLHFLHLGLPLAMVILIGVHIMRCSRPVLNPPQAITVAILILLLALSIIRPATSAPPADLTRLPINTPFDWFYFLLYPVRSALSKSVFWTITLGITTILFIMPWIRRYRLVPVQVILENCRGCDQCNKDCPYGAIYLRPRTDRLPYKTEAVIIPQRCAACGICVGACDFSAINLPGLTDIQVKEEIARLLSTIQPRIKEPRILGLACEHSVKMESLKDKPNVKIVTLPCIGIVHPSMIEQGFKYGADGIFLCGCIIGDCHYREGNLWLKARLRGERPPTLNKAIDRQRIRVYWLSPIHAIKLIEEIRLFEKNLTI